jgi:hypothetical protein
MDLNTVGRTVLYLGITLAVLGGILMLFSRAPFLRNLGHMPGDIRVESKNVSCFFPIVSMIIISLLLSFALNVILRLINR